MKKKLLKISLLLTLCLGLFIVSCSDQLESIDASVLNEQESMALGSGDKAAPKKLTKFDMPSFEVDADSENFIEIKVTAGTSGAPAGFSLHWAKKSDYEAAGYNWDLLDAGLKCAAGFSGNANISNYNLLPNASVVVRVGDFLLDNGASSNCPSELECGTTYVFRVFAHATNTVNRSDFSIFKEFKTKDCPPLGAPCTYSLNELKRIQERWTDAIIKLGDREYNATELFAILNATGGSNGLLAIGRNLAEVKLNKYLGVEFDEAMEAAIIEADGMINSKIVPPVGTGYLPPSTSGLARLSGFLNGFKDYVIGGPPCE